jgi:hypothetical protein
MKSLGSDLTSRRREGREKVGNAIRRKRGKSYFGNSFPSRSPIKHDVALTILFFTALMSNCKRGPFEASLCQSSAEREYFGCLSASLRWPLGLMSSTLTEQSRQFKQSSCQAGFRMDHRRFGMDSIRGRSSSPCVYIGILVCNSDWSYNNNRRIFQFALPVPSTAAAL